MAKYSEIARKSTHSDLPQQPARVALPEIYNKPQVKLPFPPRKRGNGSYDHWEQSYFPYLLDLYIIYRNSQEERAVRWDYKDMQKFFRFIYSVSSGKVSNFLNEMTEAQQTLYEQYFLFKD